MTKVVMHAVAGCAAGAAGSGDCIAGTIGGGLQELLGESIAKLVKDTDQQTRILAAIGGIGAALAEGNSSAIDAAANVAANAHQYNYLTHAELRRAKELAAQLANCKGLVSNCAERAALEKELGSMIELSSKNTAELIAQCGGGSASTGCQAKIKDLLAFNATAQNEFAELVKVTYGRYAQAPPNSLEARYYAAMSGEVNLDQILGKHFQSVLDGTKTPDQAKRDVIQEVVDTNKSIGQIKAAVDILGLAGGGGLLKGGGTLLAKLAGGLLVTSSGSHLAGNINQATTGLVTDPGLVQLLQAGGLSADNALLVQNLIDTGAIVAGLAEGGHQLFRAIRPGQLSKAQQTAVQEFNLARRPTPKESEVAVGADLGGSARPQVSFKNGKEVPYGTPGSVRPDWCLGNVCSVEVKNYNITTNMNGLIDNVAKQAIRRQQNLPSGMQQQVVIDVREQVVTPQQIYEIRQKISVKSNGIIMPSAIEFKRQ